MLKSSSLCLYSSNLGTFWVKIGPFWPFEEISIFSNGDHLGNRTDLTDTIFPRWPLLLKIEISSNGQNCFILRQNVSNFELYKHNDEHFNICYGIFYELWTFAYFDRLCKLEKRGDEINFFSSSLKLLSQSQPNSSEIISSPLFSNLHNLSK
jgi:hypothetical protein